MFSVYCSGHEHEVLLFASNITGITNTPGGIVVAWRCPCGTTGHWVTGARHEAANAA